MSFPAFDPLASKHSQVTEAALAAVRRELNNIISSYVGWYDPFNELIQNALDAVDARVAFEADRGNKEFVPTVDIVVDVDDNFLQVTDNGIGLRKEEFEQFLAPSFSFKSLDGRSRGHKGVGATYVAYGFNHMQVHTRSPGFDAHGQIVGARNWLRQIESAGNPQVEPVDGQPPLLAGTRGTSVLVRFDEATTPGKLSWLKADTATTWLKILRIKTGVGSVLSDPKKVVTVTVVADGKTTTVTQHGTSYLWLHEDAPKTARLRDIDAKADEFYVRYGAGRRLPDKFNKLDFIHEKWTAAELRDLIGHNLEDDELEVIEAFSPEVAVEFGYTAKAWSGFNRELGIRAGQNVLTSGIQMAANNMPQGETFQVPLQKNIGRQNQLHFLFSFDNYTPDLGRKGFHRELTDFAKKASRLIAEGPLAKRRPQLKQNTGASPDLAREMAVGEWKTKQVEHERTHPLVLSSQHFFAPTREVSITSLPTREQDVIALFHELIAGGVVRGLRVMSTNERFTYDGLFKISFAMDRDLYLFDVETNPLGVSADVLEAMEGRMTGPRVLEYKFSLDGLIEDFESGDKNINDIDLCVAWETGEMFETRYAMTSLLIPENVDQRQYHGVTHVLQDMETGSKHCDLIILSELVDSLNEPSATADRQREKYE